MNRFETLMAPTCCSVKDLARIVNALDSVPPEVKNACRTELLNPKTRLFDELTTVRMEERYTGADNGYTAFCKSLTRSNAQPIPLAYAGGWFNDLLRHNGLTSYSVSANTAQQLLAKDDLDPWFLQGAAAVARQVAINAETCDGDNAKSAWDATFSCYEKFFGKTSVESSCTCGMQKDEKQLADCRELWSRFLRTMADDFAARILDYIKNEDINGINSVLNVLNLPYIKKYSPGLYEKTLGEIALPYKNAIRQASSLKNAGELYNQCPTPVKANDYDKGLLIAMLEALRKECERIEKSHGDCKLVVTWAKDLAVVSLMKGYGALVTAEATNFFKACAVLVLKQLNETQGCISKTHAKALRDIMPEDFEIARQPDGKPITVADLRLRDVEDAIINAINSATDLYIKANASNLGARVWKIISKGTNDESERAGFVTMALNLLGDPADKRDTFIAFLSEFPASQTVRIDQFRNVGDLIKVLSSANIPEQIQRKVESSGYLDILSAKYLGEEIWGIIAGATSDSSQQSGLVTVALNAMLAKNPGKDVLLSFLFTFPRYLKINGIDGVSDIGDLCTMLSRVVADEIYPQSSASGYSNNYYSKSQTYHSKRNDRYPFGKWFFATIMHFLIMQAAVLLPFLSALQSKSIKTVDQTLFCIIAIAAFLILGLIVRVRDTYGKGHPVIATFQHPIYTAIFEIGLAALLYNLILMPLFS